MLYLQPFLNTGVTIAFFQTEDDCPAANDMLNILVTMDEMSLQDSFSMRLEMFSEPVASVKQTVVSAA